MTKKRRLRPAFDGRMSEAGFQASTSMDLRLRGDDNKNAGFAGVFIVT
jgi:hypothetical protein